MQRHRSVDEAYHQGREEGFDRGYEEGFSAARSEAKDRRLPLSKVINVTPKSSAPLTERRVLELGFLGLLAYGAARLLKTWPGRLVAVGSVFAFSGLVSFALLVLALIVGAALLAWAVHTVERAAHDTKRGVAELRTIGRLVRRHL